MKVDCIPECEPECLNTRLDIEWPDAITICYRYSYNWINTCPSISICLMDGLSTKVSSYLRKLIPKHIKQVLTLRNYVQICPKLQI